MLFQASQSWPASALIRAAMEALGPGGDRTSPASSTRSLDSRRLSAPTDSAYSSLSAASGGPEPPEPSPGTQQLPYLDWDYVRVVWGGPAPAAGLRTCPQPRPAAAARSGPRPPEKGTPGPLSRQTTPLLYALAAEAEAAARAAEPPSPPASRAAYRQRLQGAQRRVLRETSFQRKELRMSLPSRLRPATPARPSAEHPRSASLSHPGGEVEPARSGAPTQQRKWCFSEPGKLDSLGRGAGLARQCSGEVCSSSGFIRPEPREWQQRTLAEFEGHQIRWLPATQPPSIEDPKPPPLKFGNAYRPAASRSRSASGEVLAALRSSEGVMPNAQAVPQGAETPRPPLPTKLNRFLNQKEAAEVCPAEGPQSGPSDCEQRGSENCIVSARLPSLPDDEVFLEEAPLVRARSPADSQTLLGLPTCVHVSDQEYGAGLSQRTDQAIIPPEQPLHEDPETAGVDECWQGLNGSVNVSRPTCCSPPETANGDILTFDPTGLLTTVPPTAAETDLKPFPEPSLGLLDGLIPLAEVWAAMRQGCRKAGEEAAGNSEPGSYLLNSTQHLPTSQEETRPENLTTHVVPDQPCDQGTPKPNNSIQAKKAELADLLQKMLRDLQAEQKQLQGAAQAWARRGAALEAAVGQACAPHELERFSRFMADLERVLGLLLLLGSRLARVHRALARVGADSDPEEQASLLQRLGLLQRQEEDARELKQHVARRERALRELLARALPAEELRAYRTLLAGKAAVLAQQRSLDERVRLIQDQLDAVRNDLGRHPSPPRPAFPSGTHPPDKPPFPPPLI
ncbi:protein Shroom1 isoform X3 [Odocoileus virginianus]|uniref:Protein Shroom1 isoform X3 n=1 Tax=Odocoileus virginianus TaxID=9874 RepID=A0ABM4I0V9_ODOVR